MSTGRADLIGPAAVGQFAVEQHEEPRDPALDDLLDDDVGRIEARLRPGVRGVLDLRDQDGRCEAVRIGRDVEMRGRQHHAFDLSRDEAVEALILAFCDVVRVRDQQDVSSWTEDVLHT